MESKISKAAREELVEAAGTRYRVVERSKLKKSKLLPLVVIRRNLDIVVGMG